MSLASGRSPTARPTSHASPAFLTAWRTTSIESRALNHPRPDWPILWDCTGRGFARVEDPAAPITAKTINTGLQVAAQKVGILIPVTAHTARHTFCTRWVHEYGDAENSMERLSRQVGPSVTVLRRTCVHVAYTDADWEHLRSFGSR